MKKRFRQILSALLVAVMLIGTAPMGGFGTTASAEALTYGDLTYEINDGEITIIDCDESISGALTIPSEINGYPVTSIGDGAFEYCPSLTNITIPDSVKSIGEYCFVACFKLTDINVSSENKIYSSADGVLFNKSKTYLVAYPKGCNRTYYKMPETVELCCNSTFSGCETLTEVELSCRLKEISEWMFEYCENLESIKIPDSVIKIGRCAFEGCKKIEDVTISHNVYEIGYWAFRDCKNIKSLTIKGKIGLMGDSAFANCNQLANLEIREGVKIIGKYAFANCTSLNEISIPQNVEEIRMDAFVNTEYYNNSENWDNGLLYIDDCLVYAGKKEWDNDKGEYVYDYQCPEVCSIKSGTRLIAAQAFRDEEHIISISIPNTVNIICEDAFYGCTSLTSITIPDSVTSIGGGAFEDCSSLTNITIPDSVTSIGSYAFEDCTSLTDVYYKGTQEEWEEIEIGYANDDLLNATIHFSGEPQECKHELTHIKIDATCTVSGMEYDICTLCGETFNSKVIAASHTLSHIAIPSTCTVKGMEYDICTRCGDTFNSKTLPLAEHSLVHKKVAATCTETGKEYDECSVCGAILNESTIPAKGHSWGAWATTKEPTFTQDGEAERSCTVCGAKETKKIEKLKVIEDSKTGIQVGYDDEFDSGVKLDVTEVFDGASFQLIDAAYGNTNTKIFDITTTKDGNKVQPNGEITVRIPKPAGFGNNVFVCYVDTTTGNVTKIPATVEGGYVVFKTNHFSYYAVVEQSKGVSGVQIGDITLNYKKSAKIEPTITADSGAKYTVKWESSNTKVATVDENGNVYAAKKGNAKITCTVTDSYGNTVSDTCNVKVKYSFGQWMIIIFLFGFIWY